MGVMDVADEPGQQFLGRNRWLGPGAVDRQQFVVRLHRPRLMGRADSRMVGQVGEPDDLLVLVGRQYRLDQQPLGVSQEGEQVDGLPEEILRAASSSVGLIVPVTTTPCLPFVPACPPDTSPVGRRGARCCRAGASDGRINSLAAR